MFRGSQLPVLNDTSVKLGCPDSYQRVMWRRCVPWSPVGCGRCDVALRELT